MTTLEHSDVEKVFIESFCKRNLKEDDFLHIDKCLVRELESSWISGEIFEEMKEQDVDLFKRIYDVAQVLEGRIHSMGYEKEGQYEINLEKLRSLAFVDSGQLCSVKQASEESLTFSLENLGNPDEVIALEGAGFSPAKAAGLEKLLAPRHIEFL